MSSSDEEELILLALSCERERRVVDVRNQREAFFHKVLIFRVTCIVQENLLPHIFN
jgi:hypothetical protein